jgi:hypothetical protein
MIIEKTSNTQFDPRDTIAVFMFPLPSPTNYALLASLIAILSRVYARVIVVTGGFIRHMPQVSGNLRFSNKKAVFVYDIKYKLPSRSGENTEFSLCSKVLIYVKIQVRFLVAVLKLASSFKTALFFIGILHMFHILILLRLLRKKIILY